MVLHIESLQDEVERSKTQLRQKDQELDQSKHEIELLKVSFIQLENILSFLMLLE